MIRDILWDWNGTLLDDTGAALETLNDMLAARNLAPIAMDYYRANFSFPARPFYERIGMKVSDAEWDALAREYHDRYLEKPKRLNDGVIEALEMAKRHGIRQSVISALRQDYLDRETVAYGVCGYMAEVYGSNNLDGATKLERAKELMAALGCVGSETVVIGDSFHDKEVADAIGAKCILHGLGSHSPERLRAVAPTVPTILDAVERLSG